MERSKRIATSVTPEEKQEFRELAAKRGVTMGELLYELVLDEIESSEEGKRSPAEGVLAD